jgi:tetratricopeptide (TPR) repeat protein
MSLLKRLFGLDATQALEKAAKYEKLGKLALARLELEEVLTTIPLEDHDQRQKVNAELDRLLLLEPQDAIGKAEEALNAGDPRKARYYFNVALSRLEADSAESERLQERLRAIPESEEEAQMEDGLDSMLRAEVGVNFLDRQRKLEFWKSGFPPYKEEYYFKQALTSEVIQAQANLVTAHPEDADAHFNFGITLAQLGLISRALDQIRHFVELKPEDREGHFFLANLLADDGQEAEAVKEFEATLSLDPEYLEAYLYLGGVYAKLGDPERAERVFRVVAEKGGESEVAEEAKARIDSLAPAKNTEA